jgi:hypothetical protein
VAEIPKVFQLNIAGHSKPTSLTNSALVAGLLRTHYERNPRREMVTVRQRDCPGDASDAFWQRSLEQTQQSDGAVNSRTLEDNNYNYTIQDSFSGEEQTFVHSGFQHQKTYDKVKNDDTKFLRCKPVIIKPRVQLGQHT